MIKVSCMGGAGGVTGSSFLVETALGKKVLVDCGLFQGGSQMEQRNRVDWGFNPADISTLFLTHAHIDHSGRIPKLVKDGFSGRIITSPPTAELCEIMLLDSAHIQEMEAEWQTKKNKRQSKSEIQPLYDTRDAEESLHLFSPVERDNIIQVEPGIRARLRNAGHILGSSILELWIETNGGEVKVVFSGDLGKHDQLIVKDPHEIFAADYLFIESTYGDRLHRSFDDSVEELLEAISHAVSNNEKVIIPAFAVERTQELLYILGELQRKGELPDIPIYLDSPLAIKATQIFRKNKKYYDEEAMAIVKEGFDPFDMPNLKFTLATKDSMAINENPGPAIVIAANGMCTAGRIKHHLKHNLWRRGASIVIVGYQAIGTTGRKIVEGARSVKIFRENIDVNAKVYTIGGFSAHADQKDLLEWVSNFNESRPRVFVIHGEESTSRKFADKIKESFGFDAHVPGWRERLILKPREIISEDISAPEEAATFYEPAYNSIVDIEKELVDLKKFIKKNEGDLSEDVIDRLKYILEDIQELKKA
ncbi:MAG: MBL fold metallo-hydrolase [Deltaproteobacteria bacterium]|nr:MBL fold metallo-hydrolase [Deltaproteobacteria bacterium]